MAKGIRKKGTNTVVWILMGLLILGLGGFGVTNFGGSIRSIGSVGDREVDVDDYARAIDQELRAMSAQLGQTVSFQQANAMGLNVDRRVLERVIATAALDNEADRLGLSVGDEEVRRQLVSIQAFQGIDGKFDRDTYAFELRSQGLTEGEFEETLREDATRALVQGAVVGAVATPDVFADALTSYLSETRSFAEAHVIPADLTEAVPAPDDEDLRAFYEAHPDQFTRPETRMLSFAWLTPDMMADEVEIDEGTLRQLYDERIDEFVTPERRLVERLIYPDEESAAAAKARLDAGEASFSDLAGERGLDLADIDMGDVAPADLGAAADAVFALEEPGVVGPFPTDLGPALFSMNGVLAAQEITFEEAREDLATEQRLDRARRLILDQAGEYEDLLAGGTTLEQLAEETQMELGQIAFNDDTTEGIAGYTAFREAAAAVTDADFPTLVELEDGGIFALRLDEVRAPELLPIDEVGEAVTEGWTAQETHDRLHARAEEILARLEEGEALESQGLVVTRYDRLRRDGFVADAPQGLVTEVFDMAEGTSKVIDLDGSVHLVTLNLIHPVHPDAEETAAMREAIENRTAQSIAQDMIDLYVVAIEAEAGISLNQTAINAVHAQLQ